MKIDIEEILWRRLFVIYHTENHKIFNVQLKETIYLQEQVRNQQIDYIEENDFIYFYDENGITTHAIKIVPLEEVDDFPSLSYRENLKLYKWGYGKRNELVFRNHNQEERERLKYAEAGYYFIAKKIDEKSNQLFYREQRLVRGEVIYHKNIMQRKRSAQVFEFSHQKNKGKIYRLRDFQHILIREGRQLYGDDIVLSAYKENNDVVFQKIMQIHVPAGSRVLDSTFGKGVFWKQIPADDYDLVTSDLTLGIDARDLRKHYADESFFCIVFDPPYLSFPMGATSVFGSKSDFEKRYKNVSSFPNTAKNNSSSDYDIILNLYFSSAEAAFHVLQPDGVYIVKCQDCIYQGTQRFTHVEIIKRLEQIGFIADDLFVVVQKSRPILNNQLLKQKHARKNHSYFLIFRKPPKRKRK